MITRQPAAESVDASVTINSVLPCTENEVEDSHTYRILDVTCRSVFTCHRPLGKTRQIPVHLTLEMRRILVFDI